MSRKQQRYSILWCNKDPGAAKLLKSGIKFQNSLLTSKKKLLIIMIRTSFKFNEGLMFHHLGTRSYTLLTITYFTVNINIIFRTHTEIHNTKNLVPKLFPYSSVKYK